MALLRLCWRGCDLYGKVHYVDFEMDSESLPLYSMDKKVFGLHVIKLD